PAEWVRKLACEPSNTGSSRSGRSFARSFSPTPRPADDRSRDQTVLHRPQPHRNSQPDEGAHDAGRRDGALSRGSRDAGAAEERRLRPFDSRKGAGVDRYPDSPVLRATLRSLSGEQVHLDDAADRFLVAVDGEAFRVLRRTQPNCIRGLRTCRRLRRPALQSRADGIRETNPRGRRPETLRIAARPTPRLQRLRRRRLATIVRLPWLRRAERSVSAQERGLGRSRDTTPGGWSERQMPASPPAMRRVRAR